MIIGASLGLGLATAKALAESGRWNVVMACCDFLKVERAAKAAGMSKESYKIMHFNLASLESIHQFINSFRLFGMPLDVLVCNATIYLPIAREPTNTVGGSEMSTEINHLSHFFLAQELLEDLNASDYPFRCLIIIGSITGRIKLN